MQPIQVVEKWVESFNAGDVSQISALYAENATNHTVFHPPTVGREAIKALFEAYFSASDLHCVALNLFASESGWVTLEWKDASGLPGCQIFLVEDGYIVQQRTYFDQLTFQKLNGIAAPE